MKTIHRSGRYHNGAAVIEFALVAFLFFLVMWGLFEFGRAFYVVNTTQHLTRCIARQAVVLKPSEHEAAKRACLMGNDATWPFFELSPRNLTGAFRLSYHFTDWNNVPNAPHDLLDTDIGTDTSYDGQSAACIAKNNCITDVTAYFDAANNPVQTLGLLAAWIRSDSSYVGFEARTTMPAESMGFSLASP
jgi:hypothetical protein